MTLQTGFPREFLHGGTRLLWETRQVPLVEKELLTFPEYPSSPGFHRGSSCLFGLIICIHIHLYFISVYWCPSRFPYHQIVLVSFNSNTTVPLIEQELFTLPEHITTPPVYNGVGVAQSLVLWTNCLSFRFFTFWSLY